MALHLLAVILALGLKVVEKFELAAVAAEMSTLLRLVGQPLGVFATCLIKIDF